MKRAPATAFSPLRADTSTQLSCSRHGGETMFPKYFLSFAAAAAVVPTVHAQGAEQPAIRDTDESGIETIVVTGVASAGGVKKLEASYNIVTASEAEIRRANPKSTADLLKISPGMWPESSGGQ